jgi:CHAT domain-containing protein/tetratricopeptide (TPR) repeat protein
MAVGPWGRMKAVALLSAFLAVSGCQPDNKPAVSLEQAKQITAQFQGQGFTPPPRTIADITAILDQQKPDPAKAEAARKAADAEPPAGASSLLDLANFYYQRGLAAAEVGRTSQRVADLKQAYTLARENRMNHQQLMNIAQNYAFAEAAAGNIKTARELTLERLKIQNATDQGRGWYFSIYQFLGIVQARLGNLQEAQATMASLERVLQDSAAWRNLQPHLRDNWQAMVLHSRAVVSLESGRYADAERMARESVNIIGGKLVPQEQQIAALGGPPPGTYANFRDNVRADVTRSLVRQGRLVEAEAEVRASLLSRLERRGRYAPETANDVLLLAGVIYEQGRYAEAEKLAATALDIYQNLGADPKAYNVANARTWVARAQGAQGKLDAQRATFETLERTIGDDAEMRRFYLDRNIGYAFSLLRAGRADDAQRIVQNALQKNVTDLGERHYNTAQTRGMLGVVLARRGDQAGAQAAFQAAIPILLSPSRQVDDEEGSGGFERDRQRQAVIESYLGVLAAARTGAAAEEAFRLADAIRGQSVQRALAASSARAAASDPALAELVRQEQDAQKQAAALQGLLTYTLSQPASQQDADGVRSLRTQIDTLRGARAKVREEIERRFPDYVNLIDPRPATVEQARQNLRPGEALIATYVGEERTFVWAVPQSGPVAFAAADVRKAEIGRMVSDLRKALDPNATTLGDIPAFDIGLANKLYATLLQPVEGGWKQAKSLLVVPHGTLGQLPFSVLVTAPAQLQPDREGQALFTSYKAVPFLAKTAAITQLPSVASLGSLRALPPPRGERQAFIGFGDPWFSTDQAAEAAREQQVAQLQTRGARTLMQTRGVPLVRRNAPATQNVDSAELAQLPRLPDTADEVKSIAAALNADPVKDVFVGREANERRVRSMDLSNRKVVMFATHGLVPGDLNGLTQPALALSAPAVADVDGDGLLTLDEVLALKLNADWVVLSACNTATGDGAGAEAVSGLGRAFFYAGTRALLVSNWPVETTSARALTTDLFKRQAQNLSLSRAEAMRQAMVGLIDGSGYIDPDSKQPVFSYAHPIFWAPFSLVGDGGGGQPGS